MINSTFFNSTSLSLGEPVDPQHEWCVLPPGLPSRQAVPWRGRTVETRFTAQDWWGSLPLWDNGAPVGVIVKDGAAEVHFPDRSHSGTAYQWYSPHIYTRTKKEKVNGHGVGDINPDDIGGDLDFLIEDALLAYEAWIPGKPTLIIDFAATVYGKDDPGLESRKPGFYYVHGLSVTVLPPKWRKNCPMLG